MEFRIFLSIYRTVLILLVFSLLQACATSYQPMRGEKQYTADELIQEWKERTGKAYPRDNDYEYMYPNPTPQGYASPPQPLYPYPQDNDADYKAYKGNYPTYDPDQDNNPLYYYYQHKGIKKILPADNDSEYSYPLYFD